MTPQEASEFDRFTRTRRADLRRIASHTRGDSGFDDIVQEAWMLADRLLREKGIPAAFADPDYQELVIRYLYQRLVKYTERHVRHAIRLDHWEGADGSGDDAHPVARRLAASEGSDPLVALLMHESAKREAPVPPAHHSPAAAYAALLRQFDNRMRSVADFLLISVSHCYRCYGKALRSAREQTPMPTAFAPAHSFALRAWRKYRAMRPPVQFDLDFGPEPALWPAEVPSSDRSVVG